MGMSDDDRVLGDYVLLEVIGRGDRSTVHRARRRDRAGRIVAVKHLHVDVAPQAIGRLRRESQTLAALGHPAIVPLLDLVEGPDGTIALVLPYASGGSLRDVLEQRGQLPWPRVADLGAQLASGLSAAHDAGVIHGDITPANVLLGAQDAPRLADFGTAVLRQDAHVVGAEVMAAHPRFVAPEATAGAGPSPRGDIYSLGAVLERALAEQPEVPDALLAALARATASEPAHRFTSAGALQGTLAPFAAREDSTPPHALAPTATAGSAGDRVRAVPAAGSSRGLSPTAPSRAAWARAAVAGVAVVALVVGAGLWVGGRGGDAPPAASAASTEQPEVQPRQPEPRCSGVVDPDEEGRVLDADVDGRGCTLPILVTEELVDGELTVVVMVPADAGARAGRYALGQAGDLVVVGDWDCDGTDTPAVVRPIDGEVFVFDGYGELVPTRGPALPPGVEPEVVTDEDGCDHVTG